MTGNEKDWTEHADGAQPADEEEQNPAMSAEDRKAAEHTENTENAETIEAFAEDTTETTCVEAAETVKAVDDTGKEEAIETPVQEGPVWVSEEETEQLGGQSAWREANKSAQQSDSQSAWQETNQSTQQSDGQSAWQETNQGAQQSGDYVRPQQAQRRYASYEFAQNTQNAEANKKQKKKKERTQKQGGFARIVKGAVACVCGGVLVGIAAYGGFCLMNHTAGQAVITETAAPTISTTTTGTTSSTVSSGSVNAYDVSNVVSEVMPSVVSIVNTGTTEVQSFWGTVEQEYTSSGSGVIIGSNDTELLIATNNHVVTDAETLEITFVDDTTAEAVVKGKSSDMDLAVVAVSLDDLEQSTIDSIKIATLGDSSELSVGEPAIAIGNALGYGQSVTCGIISALDREVTVETDSSYGYGDSQTITSKLIQTDAAINPGNSGGPLFNMQGEVVGINSVKYASEDVEGMGYAIPISEAQPILDELMNRETRTKLDDSESGYLGITGANVTSEAQSVYGMPEGGYVVSVEDGSAAEEAGIKKGDIIVKLGDEDIDSMEDLQEALQYYAAGETLDIVVARSESGEYTEKTLEITLDKKPDTEDDE